MDLQQKARELADAVYYKAHADETVPLIIVFARAVERDALERAAAECDRHAEFCKAEAHKGGAFEHLITRCAEATYHAKRIRALLPAPNPGEVIQIDLATGEDDTGAK